MSKWIGLHLDTRPLEHDTALESGATIRYWPSPYDVPEAARTVFEGPKRLRIEFKYMNAEPVTHEEDENNNGIAFGLGRKTRRLYEITVDMEKASKTAKGGIRGLVGLISEDIKGLTEKATERSNNYRLVGQAITEAKEDLLADAIQLEAPGSQVSGTTFGGTA